MAVPAPCTEGPWPESLSRGLCETSQREVQKLSATDMPFFPSAPPTSNRNSPGGFRPSRSLLNGPFLIGVGLVFFLREQPVPRAASPHQWSWSASPFWLPRLSSVPRGTSWDTRQVALPWGEKQNMVCFRRISPVRSAGLGSPNLDVREHLGGLVFIPDCTGLLARISPGPRAFYVPILQMGTVVSTKLTYGDSSQCSVILNFFHPLETMFIIASSALSPPTQRSSWVCFPRSRENRKRSL